MTALNPLQQALVAWSRPVDVERQVRCDDAVMLAETGIFSVRHIILITGLPETFAYDLIDKKTKVGGRFNPQALDAIHDLWMQWAKAGVVSHAEVRRIIDMGVSPGMLAKLTGISRAAIYSWTKG